MKNYLLSMSKEEFNAKVLCEGFEAIKAAAKVLEVKVDQDDRWTAASQLYTAWLGMNREV